MSIFLSYASENREIAELIAFAMRARNYNVFLDVDDLPPGLSYEQKIEQEINKSDLFIFLISRNSLKSGKFTLSELNFARKKWKNPNNRVLPVLIDPIDLNKVPPYLRSVSILRPQGDVATEVCSQAAKLINTTRQHVFPPANFLRRCLSFVVDFIFIMIFSFIAGVLIAIFSAPYAQSQAALSLYGVGVVLLYFMLSLIKMSCTPGDHIFNIEVVSEDTNKKLTPTQAITWSISYLFLFYVTWLWYFFDEEKRMLHNIASRTKCIYKGKYDRLGRLGSSFYNLFQKQVHERDIEADLTFFKELFKNRTSQKSPSNASALPSPGRNAVYSWKLIGVTKHGEKIAFRMIPHNGSNTVWVIGRLAGDCDFNIEQGNISRKHAAIQYDYSSGLSIRDLSSKNGTFLNERKITDRWVPLQEGDSIDIGSSAKLKLLRA